MALATKKKETGPPDVLNVAPIRLYYWVAHIIRRHDLLEKTQMVGIRGRY